jgi:hypothetical protein
VRLECIGSAFGVHWECVCLECLDLDKFENEMMKSEVRIKMLRL